MRGLAWLAGVVGVVGSLVAAAQAGPLSVKRVASGPEDIERGVVVLPEPESLGRVSRTALIPIGEDASFEARAGRRATVVVMAKGAWSAEVSGPGGVTAAFGPDGAEVGGAFRSDGALPQILGEGRATRVRFAADRLASGMHTVRVRGADAGFVLIEPDAGATLYTYPTTLARVVGQPIGLRSEMEGARVEGVRAFVRGPDGVERVIAGVDGGVVFVPDQTGDYAVRVEVSGRMDDGSSVTLTTQHLLRVSVAAPFGGVAASVMDGVLEADFGTATGRLITAAEVWGAREGAMVPVCWVAQLGEGDRRLGIDLRWAAMAGVDPATLELRNLRSHDTDGYAMVGFVDRMPLPGLDDAVMPDAPERVTADMRTGLPGRASVASSVDVATPRTIGPGHRLLLVHGYCSGGNPFTTSHFTGDVGVFADVDQNRTHDSFAQVLLAQGSAMKSFGVAAHSQGGMAALHLRTFYWSGLDWAQGERLIQSVGAPYQGTALAGDAAVLGQVFGSGCGSNADMTYAGSAAWLSLIPTWTRQDVWYWTTSFEDRPFLYDYCNFITDLLLSDPDDGVIEQSAGQLTGATNRGHRVGWCHTAGMRDPAQCTDASRNSEINQRARR